MSGHQWSEGNRLDALIKDLHGTAIGRAREMIAGGRETFHELAYIFTRAQKAEQDVRLAISELEKVIDNM